MSGNPGSPTRCQACGEEFAAEDLKRASLPTASAWAAVSLAEPDDPVPIHWYDPTDYRWYCPSCRSRVNFQRAAYVLSCLILFVLAAILVDWWIN
jgi:hypothetical protein